MGNLTEKFETLEALLETQHSEVVDNLEAILNRLDAVNVALDIITNNNATNTKLILAAIGQNSPCAPCPTPPLVIPPTSPTPHPIDEDKCKRTQAFLHTMQEVFTVLDVASSVGVGFNPTLITDAFTQVIATLGNGDETPLISFPEAVQLVGDLVSYVATNILVGGTLNGYFSPLIFDLQDALYSSSTPEDAQNAYNGVIDGAGLPAYVGPVLKSAAYNSLYNYYFDPSTDPNLTGYDGDVCSFVGCITLPALDTTISCGGAAVLVLWDGPFTPAFDDGSGCTSADPAWTTTNMIGWTITPTQDVRFFFGGGTTHDIGANDSYTVPSATTHAAVVSLGHVAPFDVEFCPPGS